MNPKQVTVIYYFCGKKGGVHEVLGEKEEHQQSGGQDCVQPFPLFHPCQREELVHAWAGQGWAGPDCFVQYQARLVLRMLCCCLNMLVLLGGVFRNTVLLWSFWVPVCNILKASAFMVVQGVQSSFKEVSTGMNFALSFT